MKLLDRYIIKTFFGPFLFIFSVLFFIFVVNIIWIQLGQFMGKGLSYWEILKLLFYMGINAVSLVLPLTILLASIMTFGEFGERYELAAMKAAGISLTRVMMPLFVTSCFLAGLLFLFSNNIIPDFQRKAKNMLYNIAATKPALNFTDGQFIDQIPGYTIKFDKKTGENGENIEGAFIRKRANSYEAQQVIIAEKGRFIQAKNKNFLKLELYNGYVFEESPGYEYNSRLKQPDQSVKFDTLVSHFDVSEVINKAIEQEKITEDYRFQSFTEVEKTIAKTKDENDRIYTNIAIDMSNQANTYVNVPKFDSVKKRSKPQFNFDSLKNDEKLNVLWGAYQKLNMLKENLHNRDGEIDSNISYMSKVILYQQRIISFSVTCIIFFLIGASLGSIIRKGGMGVPVVIAIIIFIIFYVLNLSIENLAWAGKMNSYLAAWLPNMILFPFGVWLTYKALTDSQLFDIEKYKALLKPITKRFVKPKEHSRYQ